MWSDKSNLSRWGPCHRISCRGRFASFVVALALGSTAGCERDEAPGDGSRVVAPPTTSDAVLPSESEGRELETLARGLLAKGPPFPPRAKVIELSNGLVGAAGRLGPSPRTLVLYRAAADLRVQAWRTAHRESDAREAMDLYTSIARDALAQGLFDPGCSAMLTRATVGGELSRDPTRTYRELYVASKLFENASCRNVVDEALSTLASYRPAEEVLSGLAEQAEKDRAQALAMLRALSPAAPVVAADETGVVLAPPPSAISAARVKVLSIDPYASKDRARIVVTLSGTTSFRAGEISGTRLFLELENTQPSSRRAMTPGGLVERIRQSRRETTAKVGTSKAEDATRIELDLTAKVHRRIFYLPEPFRIVIDLGTHDPPPLLGPQGGRRTISRVAIDAGHGGVDPGAIGPTGLREKDVTLDIAHLVAPMLSNELGIVTLLTRDDDRLVPLDERAARANAFHADLFLSIHCNASENTAAHGTMSFVLDATRDETAARLAARENATSVAATSQVASIASRLRMSDLGARSTHLGELLQHATVASLGGAFGDPNDQGVKTAGFLVLVGAEMPSVLFETAFISNPAEEKRLASGVYRRRLAVALAEAVRAYRDGL